MIRKWEIYPIDQPLTLPRETEVIFVGNQRGLPVVWTRDWIIESFPPPTAYQVQVFGTGQRPPEGAHHLGTTQMPSGLVWHVFRLNAT